MSNVTLLPSAKPIDLGCTMHPIDDPIQAGQDAWARLKEHRTWADWKLLGMAIAIGRAEAMHKALTNKPTGRRYNYAFGEFLRDYGFADIQKNARVRLLQCIEHITAVEAFLETLELHERLRLNHPVIIWNRFKREIKKPEPEPPTKAPIPDWVKAFYASSLEERAAGFANISLKDFLEILPPEWRAELMNRVINVGGNKTGRLDPVLTKLVQTMMVRMVAATAPTTSEIVKASNLESAMSAACDMHNQLGALGLSPQNIRVVMMGGKQKRAA